MKIFFKTLIIFFVFQIIKIFIFIIEQFLVNSLKDPASIEFIGYSVIIAKYLPVLFLAITFLSMNLFKNNKENIISFILAFILEGFLLDKYLFIPYGGFTTKMFINFIFYTLLLFLIYSIYYKFFRLPLKINNKKINIPD